MPKRPKFRNNRDVTAGDNQPYLVDMGFPESVPPVAQGGFVLRGELPKNRTEITTEAKRLRAVYETLGFFPSSRAELGDAFRTMFLLTRQNGIKGYLDGIYTNQNRRLKDVEKVGAMVRAITHGYADHRTRARIDLGHLMTLGRTLEEEPDKDKDLLAAVGDSAPGLIIQFRDIQGVAHRDGIEKGEFDPLSPKNPYVNPSEAMKRHIAESLAERPLSVARGEAAVDFLSAEKTVQAQYWGAVLLEAGMQHAARIVAVEELGATALR
ncbi:MAG TPA: hypothetical protein VMR34_01705 [Candidatus Saccharimonadales bacterium]|nr:hypothetical protein [Candidatus Saccharimonadales bacterium]